MPRPPRLQAWVFGALDVTGETNPRAPLYYLYAAVYGLPLVRNGFDQDSFSVGLLLLGALHLQVGAAAAGRRRPGGAAAAAAQSRRRLTSSVLPGGGRCKAPTQRRPAPRLAQAFSSSLHRTAASLHRPGGTLPIAAAPPPCRWSAWQ
jgi:hypothetical protein